MKLPATFFQPSPPLAVTLFLLLAACQSEKIDNTIGLDPDGPVSFSVDVLPLLTASCGGSGCHVGQRTSGVELTNYDRIMTSVGDQYGRAIVVPHDAANSPLVDKIRPQPDVGLRMPFGRAPLTADQIARIEAWIEEGARNN